MHFSVAFAIFATGLLSLAGQSAAASVYLCTAINFSGYCVNYGVTLGQCSDLPSALNDNISSFGPDSGLNCCIYENYGCGGYSYCYTNPGVADLRTIGNGYINDRTSSVRCNKA